MIPVASLSGARVGVLGLGRSGLAAARALAAGGATPICWDDAARGRDAAAAEGFEIRDLRRPEAFEGVARLIVSPGAPHFHPEPSAAVAAACAAGAPLDNDVGLFFREIAGSGAEVVAVTGSNGKSTTAALIHHLAQEAGRDSRLGGNIGRGVLDLAPPGPGALYVVELSSYQIELASRLSPTVGMFLNLSPDHLDRHGGPGGYFAAKRRLIVEGRPATAVIGVDGPEGRFLAAHAAAVSPETRILRFAEAGAAARGLDAEATPGRVRLGAGALDLSDAPALAGGHNAANAAAAALALGALGAAAPAGAFARFPGLPHRLERVAESGGVVFVNDSKATNPDAAAKALGAFERIRWIAGGRAKEGGGLAALAPLFGRVRKAYLIGECAPAFAAELGGAGVAHAIAGDLGAALAAAAGEAEPGETVLLAPAAASFDQFPDFEARGGAFRDAVRRLTKPGPR
ncbi:MAG: UDP-N-acetylmuramoyl-L-alanine--D-glutamate ligase [Pseudomonadota bacterium]